MGTTAEALAGAFDAALTNAAADLPPAPPARVVSLVEIPPEVRKAIAAAAFGSPELIEAGAFLDAEDIFDSLVGHLSGRAQPDELPSSEDSPSTGLWRTMSRLSWATQVSSSALPQIPV